MTCHDPGEFNMTGWVGWAGHAVSASSRHVSARVRDTVLVTRLVLDTAMDTCRSHAALISPHVTSDTHT